MSCRPWTAGTTPKVGRTQAAILGIGGRQSESPRPWDHSPADPGPAPCQTSSSVLPGMIQKPSCVHLPPTICTSSQLMPPPTLFLHPHPNSKEESFTGIGWGTPNTAPGLCPLPLTSSTFTTTIPTLTCPEAQLHSHNSSHLHFLGQLTTQVHQLSPQNCPPLSHLGDHSTWPLTHVHREPSLHTVAWATILNCT